MYRPIILADHSPPEFLSKVDFNEEPRTIFGNAEPRWHGHAHDNILKEGPWEEAGRKLELSLAVGFVDCLSPRPPSLWRDRSFVEEGTFLGRGWVGVG